MAELIRKDDLLAGQYASTECSLQANKDRHLDVYKRGWNDALQAAYDNAPEVDAVEVVRCEFCKHCVGEMFFGRETFWCNRKYKQGFGMMELTDADDFCSYGERKTDG